MSTLIDLAALQDRVAKTFVQGDERRVTLALDGAAVDLRRAVEKAIANRNELPVEIDLRFDHIEMLFPASRGIVGSLDEGFDDLVSVFFARDRKQFESAWKDLWNRDDWARALRGIHQDRTR